MSNPTPNPENNQESEQPKIVRELTQTDHLNKKLAEALLKHMNGACANNPVQKLISMSQEKPEASPSDSDNEFST